MRYAYYTIIQLKIPTPNEVIFSLVQRKGWERPNLLVIILVFRFAKQSEQDTTYDCTDQYEQDV